MKIEQVNAIYYSPTGTSESIAVAIANALAASLSDKELPVVEENITLPEDSELNPHPGRTGTIEISNSFAVIAAPVYGGRVAPTAVERLKRFRACGTPCAVVAVYGNRDYEDALLELRNIAKEAGFAPLAAAAFIGEHSYSTDEFPIAESRPDSDDLAKCTLFAEELAKLVKSLSGRDTLMEVEIEVKGNMPYKEYNPSPATPQTDTGRCVMCGRCIDSCPVGCIEMGDEIASDEKKCTKCCACVKVCPFGARIFYTPYSEMLHKKCSDRKEPEWYFVRIS